MIPAHIEIAQSVVGVLTPIISLLILVGIRAVFRGNKNIEKAVTETEGEVVTEVGKSEGRVIRKIENGVTAKLEEVLTRLDKLEGEKK